MSIYENYRDFGYAIERGVVHPEVVGLARRHAELTVESNRDLTSEQLHQKPLWMEDPFYLYLVRQNGLVEMAKQLMGPDLAVFATAYIIKEPGNSPAVLWHQDGSYWPLDPMEVCTLWLAISESTPENGCMRVIPGTQKMDFQELKERSDTRNLLDSGIEEATLDTSGAVDLVLAPGDASVHHPNIVHGSAPNDSKDKWRLNLVARVISATTRVTDSEWPGVFHLCGEKREDINTYLTTPRWDESKHMRYPGCDTR